MEVVSWAVVFLAVNVPILTLLADRMLDVPAPQVIRWTWLPAGVALAAVVVRGAASPSGLAELVGWGALGGAVATVALDAVRLFGHHVLRAFPVDMPRVFGLLALGLGPRLQENVVAEMVKHLAGVEAGVRRTMLEERLRALAALPDPVRAAVVRGMRRGLETLPPEQREALVQTQLEVLASLPGDVRRSVLRAMDLAPAGAGEVYRQPRGLPRVPMDLAREFLSVAVPRTAAEAGVAWGKVLVVAGGVGQVRSLPREVLDGPRHDHMGHEGHHEEPRHGEPDGGHHDRHDYHHARPNEQAPGQGQPPVAAAEQEGVRHAKPQAVQQVPPVALYYGAGDSCVAVAHARLDDLVEYARACPVGE